MLNDPWLKGSVEKENVLRSRGIAANTYPDPMISAGVANLPTDTFDFDQEPMTQIKIGVTQMLPRGNTLTLTQQQLELQADENPLQRLERIANIRLALSTIWLETYQAQQSIALIEQDKALFDQLVAVAQLSYSSAVGRTRQQDLVRAQLELTRLEDRLIKLEQNYLAKRALLAEWIGIEDLGKSLKEPELDKLWLSIDEAGNPSILQLHFLSLEDFIAISRHPSIEIYDKRISEFETNVEIAQQKYKPQWGVNASYGYRDSTPQGMERSDFLSVGVSFDLPFFTSNKQDKELTAAKSSVAAVRTDKTLVQRKLYASYRSSHAEFNQLEKRLKIYSSRLLPQMSEQAESSLTAYTHNDGDFAEVMRARIAELNAKIEFLEIQIQRKRAVAKLQYVLTDVQKIDTILARYSNIKENKDEQ